MAMTWGVETDLASRPRSSRPPRRVHGQGGWSFGFLFLYSSFVFKDEMLTRNALYVLGTGWKDFGIAGGWGENQQPNRRAVSGPVFIFKNRQTQRGACPLLGGVTHGLPHLTPMEALVSCPGRHPILCTFTLPSPAPSLPRSWSLFYYLPFLIHVYHIM